MSKGRNNKGSKSAKVEITHTLKSPFEITKHENFECRIDIGTKSPKVEMTFDEMSIGRNNNGLKSAKVEAPKKQKVRRSN